MFRGKPASSAGVRAIAVVGVSLCLISGLLMTSASSNRQPPTPDAGESPLTANETATLWSKANGNCEIQGTSDQTMEELSRCTDVTFKEPPHTAATWTRTDFGDLAPGNRSTSVYPAGAERASNGSIEDAHASLFAVHPSTRLHTGPGEATVYVTPNGTVRGFVDYRVQPPATRTVGNRTIGWSVSDHSVSKLRIRVDDEVVATASDTQLPVIDYSTAAHGSTMLQLEATIEVHLQREVTVGNDSTSVRLTSERTDTVTVSDSMEVSVYRLEAYSTQATYPNNDTGLSIYQTAPWHGFSLGGDDNASVRGVWRYYTARDAGWDVLNSTTRAGTTQQSSDAIPAYVHAYPAHVGPRTEPVRDGPTLVDQWGVGHSSPAPSLHENVTVGVVDAPYNRSDGLVVRHDEVDVDDVVVRGIVRNVTATPNTFADREERQIRESNLTIERIDTAGDAATYRLELRDETTGDPIVLDDPALNGRGARPVGVEPRDGYITVRDQQVQTNESGVAVVTFEEPGSYTATYEPDTWRANDPAYVGDTAHISWHPLWTVTGWLRLLYRLLEIVLPFLVALYAGYRLNTFLQIDDHL